MSALVDEVARERAHGVGSEAAAVGLLGQEQVDPGLAVLRVVHLLVLDEADELAVVLDRESHRLVAAVCLPLEVVAVGRAPPARDSRLGLDLGHALDVVRPQRPEDDELTAQRRHIERTGHGEQA